MGTVPENDSLQGLGRALCAGHKAYIAQQGQGREMDHYRVLFVVQAGERNTMDQRALEYELLANKDGRILCLRATLGEVFARASNEGGALFLDGFEISVAYFRAGYTPKDYPTEGEWRARALIEHARAVKCPCIAYHLAGTKKVQQALTKEGELEKFVQGPDAAVLRYRQGNSRHGRACYLQPFFRTLLQGRICGPVWPG